MGNEGPYGEQWQDYEDIWRVVCPTCGSNCIVPKDEVEDFCNHHKKCVKDED